VAKTRLENLLITKRCSAVPLRLPRKLDQLVHEAYPAVCLSLGSPITFAENSQVVIDNRLLAPASESQWCNRFEDEYYATPSPSIAYHAPGRLLELRYICIIFNEVPFDYLYHRFIITTKD
jgi:hypothetical protein